MKYSIVIPTYNNCDKFLKPCIQAILTFSNIKNIELIVVSNGSTDNTFEYLGNLKDDFNYLGLGKHIKVIWSNVALGYAKAVNEGIKASTCDKVVLFNNDAILLPQEKNFWLNVLDSSFSSNSKCGISCSLKRHSEIINMDFATFFCAMVDRKLINEIGLLDEQFEIGGNEDIDYCARAQLKGYEIEQPIPLIYDESIQLHVGAFPIYHQGEGTVHNKELVSDYEKIFRTNELKLALKYNNIDWYSANKYTV